MKITLAILALLVAFSYAENECQVFKCGTINQQDGQPQICAEKQTVEGEANQWFGDSCTTEGEFCQSTQFDIPTNAPEKATCGTGTVYDWPPTWTPGQNDGVDGDHCETATDCFGDLTCVDGTNTCGGAIADGEACTAGEDKACKMGSWCQADNTCGPLLGAGVECPRENACAVGHTCVGVQNEDGTDGTLQCTSQNTLANAVIYKNAPLTMNEQSISNVNESLKALVPEVSTACTSWNAVPLPDNKLQCRQGATSESLTVDNLDARCTVTEFVADEPENSGVSSTREVVPLCGFNSDNKAHCPLEIGDSDFVKEYTEAVAAVQKLSCHRTNFAAAGNNQCKAWRNAAESRDKTIFKASHLPGTLGTTGHQLHANLANNDKCVANSITQHLWKGFGDAYLSYSVVGMFATAFAYILM